jgi:hypothetical protein
MRLAWEGCGERRKQKKSPAIALGLLFRAPILLLVKSCRPGELGQAKPEVGQY